MNFEIVSDDEEPEVFDFNSPEDVLIEVVEDGFNSTGQNGWKGFTTNICTVIRGKDGVTGAASYEQTYGGFLDYTIEGLIECPGEGWFVVEGVTGEYFKGDGWMTDDDMEFDCKGVRPATPDEIALA